LTPRGRADRRLGLLYLSPALIALGGLTVYPGLWVFWLSLQHRMPIFGIERFDGLDNYRFLSTDPRFWSAAHVTLVFAVASVSLEVILGVGVALLLWTQQLGRRLALGLLLLAWALPAVVTTSVGQRMLDNAGVTSMLGTAPMNPIWVDCAVRPMSLIHHSTPAGGNALPRRLPMVMRAQLSTPLRLM